MEHILIDAGKGGISSKTIVIIVVPTVVSVVIFSILCYCFICRSARKKYDTIEAEKGKILVPNLNDPLFLVTVMVFTITINVQWLKPFFFCAVESNITTEQSLQFDLATIQAATNNFSDHNKIGEGGFGAVYKVELYKCS